MRSSNGAVPDPGAYLKAAATRTAESGTIRLILLSPNDPADVRTWSGTPYFAYSALKELNPDIVLVGRGAVDVAGEILLRLTSKLGFVGDFRRSRTFSAIASLATTIRLWFKKGDAIVAMAAATHVYALQTSRPIIYVSDATFASIVLLYEDFAAFPRWLQLAADAVERQALARSRYAVFSSEWAKRSAVQDYSVPADAVIVAPLGPNITRETIDRFRTVKVADFEQGVRILFVAADWKRKGGPIVLEIKRILEALGVPCELSLVGNHDPDLNTGKGVNLVGRLDKSDPEALLHLCRLYEQAHFLVLPTLGEAFGVVFSEAQAFGCPSLTYAVGGTPTAVEDGRTGFTLPLGAPAAEFAGKIVELVRDPRRYEEMSANCRSRYQAKANWSSWARQVMELAAR